MGSSRLLSALSDPVRDASSSAHDCGALFFIASIKSCVWCFSRSSSACVTWFWWMSSLVFKVISSNPDLRSTTRVFWKRLHLLCCCKSSSGVVQISSGINGGLHTAEGIVVCDALPLSWKVHFDACRVPKGKRGVKPGTFWVSLETWWRPGRAGSFPLVTRAEELCWLESWGVLKLTGRWEKGLVGKLVLISTGEFSVLGASVQSRLWQVVSWHSSRSKEWSLLQGCGAILGKEFRMGR